MNTEKQNEDFVKDLDLAVQHAWIAVRELFEKSPVKLANLQFFVDIDEVILNKHGLNKDVTFVVDAAKQKMQYCYKSIPLQPDAYYLRPKDYQEVTTLQMLHEAIKQDTSAPDIKHLESPSYKAEEA